MPWRAAGKRRLVVRVRNDTGGSVTLAAATGTNYLKLTDLRIRAVSAASVVASDIVGGVAAFVHGVNAGQLSDDVSFVEPTTTALLDEVYEDELPAAVLDRLALLHTHEWAVWEDRLLRFRPKGSGGRAWYVDVAALPGLERSLENVRNSAYAVYRDAGGRTLRTPAIGNVASQTRYGVVRRGFVGVQSSSLTEAQLHRAVYLADRADRAPRADISFERLYDAAGGVWPLYSIRAGDSITMRNLPPTADPAVDRVRTFLVSETSYDAISGVVDVSPEEPAPTLARLVARREAGLPWPSRS